MQVSLTMNVIFYVLQVSGRNCEVYSRVCASVDVRSTGRKQCGGRSKTWGYVLPIPRTVPCRECWPSRFCQLSISLLLSMSSVN